ncbi:MAG: PQQ-binding-like beta-propeller repeat protein [Phycisphaerae bacterium]
MRRIAMGALIVACVAAAAPADPPVGWRTDGTGRYPQTQPPSQWSQRDNVLWHTPTPQWSNAMPVVVNGKVVVTAEPATLMCVDASDGSVLWQEDFGYDRVFSEEELAKAEQARQIREELSSLERELRELQREIKRSEGDPQAAAELEAQAEQLKQQVEQTKERLKPYRQYLKPPAHGTNGYASATPVCDGRDVFAVFGTAVAVCCGLDGKVRWIRRVDRPRHGWGHSTSPVLAADKLILHINDITALDPESGEELWRTPAQVSFGTPAVVSLEGGDIIITPRGDFVRAEDGRKLASVNTGLEYNSPIVHDGVVYFVADSKGRATAVRLPEAAEPFEPELLWQVKITENRYYGSPVFRDGRIYAVTQSHQLTVLDASDGSTIYETRMPGMPGLVFPSIVMTRDSLLVSTEKGMTVLLSDGDEYEELGRNKLGDFRSTPVFDEGRMYVRTRSGIFCISSAAEED